MLCRRRIVRTETTARIFTQKTFVDARCEINGGIKGEARGEEGGLVEKDGEVANGLVGGVLGDLAAELLDDGVVGVDLEGLLGLHCWWERQELGKVQNKKSPGSLTVGRHAGVAESLSLHDALHCETGNTLGPSGKRVLEKETHCWKTIRTVR